MAMKVAMVVLAALVCLALTSPRTVLGQSCNPNNYINLRDCLPAAMGTGGVTSNCCSEISSYRGNPNCLCQTLLTAKQAVSSINIARAMSIPKSCNFGNFVPSGFKCGGVSVPSSAP